MGSSFFSLSSSRRSSSSKHQWAIPRYGNVEARSTNVRTQRLPIGTEFTALYAHTQTFNGYPNKITNDRNVIYVLRCVYEIRIYFYLKNMHRRPRASITDCDNRSPSIWSRVVLWRCRKHAAALRAYARCCCCCWCLLAHQHRQPRSRSLADGCACPKKKVDTIAGWHGTIITINT